MAHATTRAFRWPPGFERVPREDWAEAPVEALAAKYDTVEQHGWYSNLDPTVEELASLLKDGDVLVDYSGGTGILVDRLFRREPRAGFGVVVVDSSPKFLRLALEKFRDDERVGFRLIRFLKPEKRLERVDEVLPQLVGRADAVASTNAVHLYRDLEDTFASWARVLRRGGRALVQSGNIRLPTTEGWIIDDTVEAVHREALAVVREDDTYARYRDGLDDAARMAAHDEYRRRVFLPPRPLDAYAAALESAGLRVERVEHRPVRARTSEWLEFLSVYHDAILGWLGGSGKVEGRPAAEEAVRDRMRVLHEAVERVFDGSADFEAVWTYVTAVRE